MSKQKIIHLIAGARPNFMKMAPLYHALQNQDWAQPVIIHTGQHYDANMSDNFFKDLKLPAPDVHLGCGGGSHAHQTARIMMAYDELLDKLEVQPDMVIVAGDVNSTLACTLVASKRHLVTAHLEAGLRSFDMSMPEEINRKMTDSVADFLLTPSPDANEHLKNEGVPDDKIWFVGNIMMDSFEMLKPQILEAAQSNPDTPYILVTMHRPANVDNKALLEAILQQLKTLSQTHQIIWPLHPRTKKMIEEFGLSESLEHFDIREPLPYIEFMALMTGARLVLTDSGGLQEESTYLGIDCLTVRPNTERPITISEGTNRLIVPQDIYKEASAVLDKDASHSPRKAAPQYWDGKTAGRIIQKLQDYWSL
jgi:UDP-N-acetylglucosamine 2-epimerase (non-hydrolysing)